ncbi:site-specific integrase [Streptomyces sp. NBC_00247]|uniref:tyrosine-type recombinase/integrase n=1 Tax=Streptomyces sp. NBC_00247 TaxID=2975689 RepID=UPI002E2E54BA|nr:site-specific integrase [Streptomyces sp. NBC_00247]
MKGAKGISRAKAQRESKAKIQIPTILEIREIADAIRPQYRALVWVMVGCGLRIGEASALTVDSIDFANHSLRVNRQVARDSTKREDGIPDGASGRLWVRNLKHKGEEFARTLPLPDFVSTELRRHLRDHKPWGEDGYLFPNITRTNYLDRSAWSRVILGEAVAEAGISRTVRGHWFRHYFASVCLAAGVPITDLANWLGHSSPQIVLDTYAHLMPDAPDRTRTAMDAALGGADGGTLVVDLRTGDVLTGADAVLTFPAHRHSVAGGRRVVASRG